VTDPNDIITFGCRLNAYESEVIRQHLDASGQQNTVVVNSCAVTAEAERQLRQSLRKLRRERPEAKIILTGCAAQIHPDEYAAMEEVDLVLGNEEKMQARSYQSLDFGTGLEEKTRVNDIMSVKETALHLVDGLEGKSRAFIQVQNGCNHRCTFCIIPYGRGNSRSVPIGEIVTQVRELVAQGYKEVVITGVDISDYGKDLPGAPTLGQMLRRLLALVPQLPRLRLSSIDAVEVDDDLLHLIEDEPRLMPHMHLSLQAGDDMILKRMKRRHLRADILHFCEEVRRRRPDVVFGADIIAGFPTETDEMFANTLNIIAECELAYLHVFPYSPRPGTPAAKMPPVSKAVRKARAAQLRAAGEEQFNRFLHAQTGREIDVLVEKDGTGRSEHFAPVSMPFEAEAGSLHRLTVTGVENNRLRVA